MTNQIQKPPASRHDQVCSRSRASGRAQQDTNQPQRLVLRLAEVAVKGPLFWRIISPIRAQAFGWLQLANANVSKCTADPLKTYIHVYSPSFVTNPIDLLISQFALSISISFYLAKSSACYPFERRLEPFRASVDLANLRSHAHNLGPSKRP